MVNSGKLMELVNEHTGGAPTMFFPSEQLHLMSWYSLYSFYSNGLGQTLFPPELNSCL